MMLADIYDKFDEGFDLPELRFARTVLDETAESRPRDANPFDKAPASAHGHDRSTGPRRSRSKIGGGG